ncbi:hypothetical protein J2847_006532 [Azospirillum agricola]|uniref:DUF3306 domain-containing protein n=1 Tax=Azospirillum agricola TaxID=1720247 RepID=UPI001F274635|nr:DUF3306 domain-containing protein [Azospirillum agricola]MBP2233197.1 hypothetical protein [Azospirillum agricola]
MAEKPGTDGEGFLGRWSRLKRTAKAEPEPMELAEPMPPAPVPQDALEAPPAARPVSDPALPEMPPDLPPDLPPVESLDAGSDYTAFLKREVPADLRRLALRKAWTSDPAIAAFRGFGEYDWDCNAPGYGALRPTDDVKSLLAAIFPDPEPDAEAKTEASTPKISPSPPRGEGGGEGDAAQGIPVTAEAPPDRAGPEAPAHSEISATHPPHPDPLPGGERG